MEYTLLAQAKTTSPPQSLASAAMEDLKENLLAFFTLTQTIFFINCTQCNTRSALFFFFLTPCTTLHFSLYAAAALRVSLSLSLEKTWHAAFYNLYMFDFFYSYYY